jgi:hypothetical protein
MMQEKKQDVAQDIMNFLESVQLATTNEIGLHLIANQSDPASYVPSRQQLGIILEAMCRDNQLVKIKKIRTNYLPDGFEITETRMRSVLWKLQRQDCRQDQRGQDSHAVSA